MKRTDKYITALIDGEPVRVPRGFTVLDAARQAGIYIPTLCYLENLKSYGGCRLCIVEIKGSKGYPTACTTPLEPGMEISTGTPELQTLRRNILEMTLSEHPYTCLVCGDKKECGEFMHTTRKAGTITGCNFCTSNGDCELQDLVDYLGLSDVRYPIAYRGIPPVRNNPFYDIDYNLCVLCGRCVRICNEERNSNVLAFVQRGNSTLVGTAFSESQAEAGCEFCGACVDVCPTGSITGKMGKWAGPPDRSTETTCPLCSVACTMNVNTRGSRIVDVGPGPGKRTGPHQLCIRGKFLPGEITHHPDRVTAPMIRKKGKWTEVTWEEAIRFTAGKLEPLRGEGFGLIGSAQDTMEENYALQKFARLVMQSNNVDLYSSYPDRESAQYIHSLTSSAGGNGLSDIHKADTILLIGTDASVSHPLLENRVRKAFHNGSQILYANTCSTRTSLFASQEMHYLPDRDYHFLYVLLAGLAGEIRSELPSGKAGQFRGPDVRSAMEASGIEQDRLKPFVRSLAASRNLWVLAGDDILRNGSGKDTLQALGNLKALKLKHARCTVQILGYEGNLVASMLAGAHPDFLPGMEPVSEVKTIQKWNRNWGDKLSSAKGLTSSEMLAGAEKSGVSALMVAGDVPASGKLRKVKLLVQMNMFFTPLSEFADVFLPVTGFLENGGHFMALDGKIKKLNKTIPAPGKSRTIPQILSELAASLNHTEQRLDSAPASIWKEMRFMAVIPVPPALNGHRKFLPLKPPALKGNETGKGTKKGDWSSLSLSGYDHFTYRGNRLTELVPDLKAVIEEQATGTKKKA
jgi:formate dehydrogenase alpha subunit